jgi:hypothetical protein
VFDADQGALGGGVMVRTYLNKFSMAGTSGQFFVLLIADRIGCSR